MERKTILVPTDINDPATSEPLYTQMRKPNWFRYKLGWYKLWLSIICWNPFRWEEEWCLSPWLAWHAISHLDNYREHKKIWDHYHQFHNQEARER